jgi:protein involved in ribonucleotide reduction
MDTNPPQSLAVVFFSTSSGGTREFAYKVVDNPLEIPIKGGTPLVSVPYILLVPTYADGEGNKAVPPQVIKFLNIPENRDNIRGVVGMGNRNFGRFFGVAADVIHIKCNVPIVLKVELRGTDEDVETVKQFLTNKEKM